MTDEQILGIITSVVDNTLERYGTKASERNVNRDDLESAAGLGIATAIADHDSARGELHVHAWNRARYHCLRELASNRDATRIQYVGRTQDLTAISDAQQQDDAPPAPPANLIDDENETILDWWTSRLDSEVQRLPKQEQETIIWFFGLGRNRAWQMPFVAHVLKMPVSTAYAKRDRGIQRIRQRIERDPEAMKRVAPARQALRKRRAAGRITGRRRVMRYD